MKEQIKKLIQHHKESRKEVWSMLEELSQIDTTKLTGKEGASFIEYKIKFEEEYAWRGVFITDLENLLKSQKDLL